MHPDHFPAFPRFFSTWGITSGGGPLLTGILMHSVGVNALPAVMWVCAAIFVGSAVWERKKGIV